MLYAPLSLLVCRNVRKAHFPVTLSAYVCKRDLRTELLRLPRLVNDAVEFVDLLESKALGLVDHEVTGVSLSALLF